MDLACRILIGFGSGAAFIAGAGVVAGVEKHAALAQGLYGGCVQIGSGRGLLVTPWLAGLFGWQGAFLFWGVASLLPLLLWLFVRDKGETRCESRITLWPGCVRLEPGHWVYRTWALWRRQCYRGMDICLSCQPVRHPAGSG